MVRSLHAFALGALLSAGAVGSVAQESEPDARRAACAARDGVFRSYRAGSTTRWYCETGFADAGKVCSAEQDCLGACTLPDGYVQVMGQPAPATGTCQARTRMGCMTILDKGEVLQFCVD